MESRIASALSLGTLALAPWATAEPFASGLEPFFERHCYECHDDVVAEADLDLYALGTDLADPATFAEWERIFDRVADGEMPPAKKPQPSGAERAAFAEHLAPPLVAAHGAAKGTVLRRLNRQEYENTLNDLFGTGLDLAAELPEDGRSHGFDTVGDALGISMVQMRAYLDAIGRVLDDPLVSASRQDERKQKSASYATVRDADKFLGKNWLELDDGAVVHFRQWGYPSGLLRGTDAHATGKYRVRITGYAYQSDAPLTFELRSFTWSKGQPPITLGYFSLPPGVPTTVTVDVWLEGSRMLGIEPMGLFDPKNVIKDGGIENYTGPGVAIKLVEMDGPIVDAFPGRGNHLLYDGLDRTEIPPDNPSHRQHSWYRARYAIKSANPVADVAPVLRRVAARAFRRPAGDAEIAPYLDLFANQLGDGAPVESALRTAVSAIFCSPDFLYLREPAGALDDYALASRLSYFLSRTTPDEELLRAAEAGELTASTDALGRQTDRLLADARAGRFIRDFTDGWLDLRSIEDTNPDEQLFPEFDGYLQYSMLEESRGFFRELLTENLSIDHLVRSDFALINERLAEHYGIGGVDGPEFRRVSLPAESPRGGILGQASIHKVTANGTNSSPVRRGAWVLEHLLGEVFHPPPPGTPGVEPDIRGAKTLREILDQHRSQESCQSCHAKIDPPGFALESFNPIGAWRDRFRSIGEGEKVVVPVQNGWTRYRTGPPVDASGRLADGRTFDGFLEFRDHLADDPDGLTRALAEKLLVFATGRELGFSDRAELDRITRESAASGRGVGDLVRLVVTSEIFRHK